MFLFYIRINCMDIKFIKSNFKPLNTHIGGEQNEKGFTKTLH